MTVFASRIVVRFRHCDPARIVFYPRYFEMLNDAVEDWFAAIGWGFEPMMARARRTIPLAAVEARFFAPSRLGDILAVRIAIARIGRTSCTLDVTLAGEDGRDRVHFSLTIVCVDSDSLRPEPWPDELRAAMQTPVDGLAP
jgi:4-hydroxybenzoyl-CoA thioesterase